MMNIFETFLNKKKINKLIKKKKYFITLIKQIINFIFLIFNNTVNKADRVQYQNIMLIII